MASTPEPNTKVHIVWVDAEGKEGPEVFNIQATAAVGPLLDTTLTLVQTACDELTAGIVNASNAVVRKYTVSQTFFVAQGLGTEASSGFDSIEDKLLLNLIAGDGTKVATKIPAPIDGLFATGDNETFYPGSTEGAALLTLLTSPLSTGAGHPTLHLTSASGQALGGLDTGYRIRAKTRRKFRPGVYSEQGGD